MKLKRSVYTFTSAAALVASQGYGGADAKAQELRDSQGQIHAARQSVASIFTSLFDSILQIRNGNSPSITPQYKLAFSAGAGGKVVNTASGFECESECEVALTDVLRASYEVIPDEDYQFAGWSGDICSGPDTYLNSTCNVVIGWSRLGTDDALRVKANYSRDRPTRGLRGLQKNLKYRTTGSAVFFPMNSRPCCVTPLLMTVTPVEWAREPLITSQITPPQAILIVMVLRTF